MMVLGQAVGTTAASFRDSVRDFNATALRAQLSHYGAALDLQTGYLDVMPDIEPLKLMLVAEPTHPENVDALLEITRSTSIPITTDERNTTH